MAEPRPTGVGPRVRRVAGDLVRSGLGHAGFALVKQGRTPRPLLEHLAASLPDLTEEDRAVVARATPHTLTSPERIAALIGAVRHVVAAGIPGAIAECGVWRGGSMVAAAATLAALGEERDLWLYDTYDHVPPPGPEDGDIWGHSGTEIHTGPLSPSANPAYAFTGAEAVHDLVVAAGCPPERLHVIAGLVEETIPAQAPERLALLRLDTDWYGSTRHELDHLLPRLSPGGILLVDDYGEFLGCRKAVDEVLAERAARTGTHVLLHRIDHTGRIAVVP